VADVSHDAGSSQTEERAMLEAKIILEVAACLATLIMLALAVADWVLKFLA
jgi:hypothetical protein